MNIQTIKKIQSINNTLYQTIANEFSETRNYPWKGWEKLWTYLSALYSKNITIADIGCGNGRFAAFLHSHKQKLLIHYTGFDNSLELITIAKKLLPNEHFIYADMFSNSQIFSTSYDCIALFGVLHHISGCDYRIKWLTKISSYVQNNGLLFMSIWCISDSHLQKIGKKYYKSSDIQITEKELESGDFFIPWGNTNRGLYRYYHQYSLPEIDKILQIFTSRNFELIHTYISDTSQYSYNRYFVFKKIP
jgi:tRNA (uracil-5-)-methyltransferase TRM9